jgi:hypothetical protein
MSGNTRLVFRISTLLMAKAHAAGKPCPFGEIAGHRHAELRRPQHGHRAGQRQRGESRARPRQAFMQDEMRE